MSNNPSFEKLKSKIPDPASIDYLIEELSASEFGSLILEIYRQRVEKMSPSQVLRDFGKNRFTQPLKVEPIQLLKTEAKWLKKAKKAGFTPILLSPVSPLGTCSAVAKVNQNNVVSALRNTEVVADATNVLALQLSQDLKNTPKPGTQSYATVHRHVRAQHYENPNFTAHFGIFCLASAGKNRGNFDFELEEANRHIKLLIERLEKFFPRDKISFKFFLRDENPALRQRLQDSQNTWTGFPVTFHSDSSQQYYQLFQFKIYAKVGENLIDFADGGPVDWVASLSGNKKMRCFISGIGLELVLKLGGSM
ncbi:hypothetical protein J0A67_08135 [Algoriphagus aestuariicola]|uniref:Uncharacterized protein n=1 Tax=Algoriphagus aestuariicola TaxID=1852016 RepID=A0ABS3BP45_9BACT|nr:hypothetical protein [Algoriphagus aestuariicola]MBN7800825.1 hypothetical protein [Algoriphagus aestuariicola]